MPLPPPNHASQTDADTVLCPFILNNSPCEARVPPGTPLLKMPFASGLEAYVATEPEHVRTVFTDSTFSAQDLDRPPDPESIRRVPPLGERGSLIRRDRDIHLLARRILSTPLSHTSVEPWRARFEELVHARLDGLTPAAGTPVEFKSELAEPVMHAFVPQFLGIDIDTDRVAYLGDFVASFSSPLAQIPPAREEIYAHFDRAIRDRAPGSGSTLIDGLLAAAEEGRLDREDVLGLTAFIYLAGAHGMASYLTSAIYALLRHPEQWQLLCRQPGLLKGAVEELTRYVPFTPVGGLPRSATEDIRLGSTDLRRGDIVFPALGFANRNFQNWPQGDRLDITRSPQRHLGFGIGIHYCLGAALARFELEICLAILTQRLPELRLAAPAESLAYRRDHLIRSLEALPVIW